jgi:guanylate kinase
MGKTPLVRALQRFFPELKKSFQSIVLYNSRSPRPGEQDGIQYHFRPRNQIEDLRKENQYVVMEARGDLQALDFEELHTLLERGDVLYEGNPMVGRMLRTHPRLASFTRLSIFLSPLSHEEISWIQDQCRVDLTEFVADVMRRKLLRRTHRHSGPPSLRQLEDIERRAGSAYSELREGWQFDYVIPNHDGEDSDHWEQFPYPIGDARRTLMAVAALLRGDVPSCAEVWNEDLVP